MCLRSKEKGEMYGGTATNRAGNAWCLDGDRMPEGGNYTSNYNYNYSRFYAKFYIVVGLDLGSKNVQGCTHQKR